MGTLQSSGLRQGLWGAEGIQMAFKDGIDWILHIDTDELVYPGGAAEFSLQRVLMDVPADVDTLVFPNYESLPERDDIVSPFTEVRLSPTQNVSSFRDPTGHGILGNGSSSRRRTAAGLAWTGSMQQSLEAHGCSG